MVKSDRFWLNSFIAVLTVMVLALTGVSPQAAETNSASAPNEVTFNFVDVDITAVTKFISEITGKNFIFDERVKGKVTIIAPTKLSIDDAYALYVSILELKGFTVAPSGVNAYKIISTVEARQKGIEVANEALPLNESFVARIIPLKNISADDALKLTQPLVSRHGFVSSFGPGNMLLVVDSGLNIDKILSIIGAVDKPSVKEEPELVFLKHANAETVVKILNSESGQGSQRAAQARQGAAQEQRAVADQRLNAVILFGDSRTKDSMKSLIASLDIPSPTVRGKINVCFLEHADATELAEVLTGLVRGTQPQAAATSPKGTVAVTPFAAAEGISITADKSTNSLLIVAEPHDYENLLQIIKQLDRRRRQVFVEAMIVEASVDRLRELGTQWRVIGTHNDDPVAIGGFGTVDAMAMQSLIYGLTGLSGGGMGNFLDIPFTTVDPSTGEVVQSTLNVPGFAVLLSLNEFSGAVNVLSTPQILTSDNKEAEIVVGENVPFITSRERDITTTNTVLSSIERHDVGIKLRITPQITEGDYIKLDIYQEISSVKQDSDEILINVGPSTTKRSTETTVVVRDNQTVVIGGLMEEKEEETINKIPLLGDIPILGWAFKSKGVSKKKTNLLVFLTPHVVKDASDLDALTKEKQVNYAKKERQFAAGELLVKFSGSVTAEEAENIIAGQGASIIEVMKGIGVYHIRLKEGVEVEEALRTFSGMDGVEYAEPNYIMQMQQGR